MGEKSAPHEALSSLAEVGPAVQRFVAAQKAGPHLRVSSALGDIAWPEDLTIAHGAAVREDQTSVTPCARIRSKTRPTIIASTMSVISSSSSTSSVTSAVTRSAAGSQRPRRSRNGST